MDTSEPLRGMRLVYGSQESWNPKESNGSLNYVNYAPVHETEIQTSYVPSAGDLGLDEWQPTLQKWFGFAVKCRPAVTILNTNLHIIKIYRFRVQVESSMRASIHRRCTHDKHMQY